MKQEAQSWWQQAREDIDAAQYNFQGSKLSLAAFMCQQAVEKALKALLIQAMNEFPKIHDLVRLARLAKAPQEILELCAKINPAYTATRYPDSPVGFSEKDCEKILNYAREVLRWTEEKPT